MNGMKSKVDQLGAWQEKMLLRGQSRRRGYGRPENRSSMGVRVRVRIVWAVCIAMLAMAVARVVYLQVFESGQQILLSQANHIELKRIEAPRGVVYDHQGMKLSLNPATAPVLGYLSEVVPEELGCASGICYEAGMWAGRAGVQKTFERSLRGRDGGIVVEVDAFGREVRELGRNEPEAGNDLTLAIDAGLQEKMYQVFAGRPGAAVMIDMQGKVMGLVSSPAYDPTRVAEYLGDIEQLFFLNRAIAGSYPPGSIFKLVTAYAGLAGGSLTGETKVTDSGEIKIGEYRYGNWYFDQYGRTEGELTLVRALARSNDIFFYKVGEEAGVDKLVAWAKKFGLGEATGIELPGEEAGLVPDRLWKERKTGEKWFLGNTYHLAIGQGDLLVTPLQAARMTLAAVSGRLCAVSLLKNSGTECRGLGLTSEQLSLVREGMKEACAAGGTAYPFFEFDPYVLCKTGTAQHAGQKTEEDLPHAWITVAYPGDNPKIILTVLLEGAGEGSAVAGAVAKEILASWRDAGN